MEKLLLDFRGVVIVSVPDFPSKHQHSSMSYGFCSGIYDVLAAFCSAFWCSCFFASMCEKKDDHCFATRYMRMKLN